MKIIPSSQRHRYVAIVSIALVAVALIAGMVACARGESYVLAITSTEGGSVTTPGEGMFTYDEGTVVVLTAEAEEGYRFVEWTGDLDSIDNVDSAVIGIRMHDNRFITANFGPECTPMVAASSGHTVGLKDNGRVLAIGDNSAGQCDVGSWRGITQVSAGWGYTVGLKSDGTVVPVGNNEDLQCNVRGWGNIIQVVAGGIHTAGLKSDGTVVAVGLDYQGQCSVVGWTDIIQIEAGWNHTVGLKSNGTVVAVGLNNRGQCDVGGWDLIP